MTDKIKKDKICEPKESSLHTETRHLVIYGYTHQELAKVMKHFEAQLPEFVKITIESTNLVTTITLKGMSTGVELLRFQMNRYHNNLTKIFTEDVVSMEDKTVAEVLGCQLHERELTVACAESCTGGNIAHRITQVPGSSSYFLGSVVSYSNDVKADVLGVKRHLISSFGAVSKEVAEAMVSGVSSLMRSDCAIATTGIAGPDGGSKYKPVGTVWIAVKYGENIVSECLHFKGTRNEVIESATNHGMVMLINLLRNTYVVQEEVNDD